MREILEGLCVARKDPSNEGGRVGGEGMLEQYL